MCSRANTCETEYLDRLKLPKRGATIFQYKSRRRRCLRKECIPSESGGREDARVKELTIFECVRRERTPVCDGLVFTLNHVVASKWPERSSLLPWHRPVPTDIYRWWSSKVLCDASTVGLPSTKTNAKLVETSGDLMTASLFVQQWYQHWPDFDLWSFSFTRSPAANLTFNFHLRLSLASPICLFNNKKAFLIFKFIKLQSTSSEVIDAMEGVVVSQCQCRNELHGICCTFIQSLKDEAGLTGSRAKQLYSARPRSNSTMMYYQKMLQNFVSYKFNLIELIFLTQ